MSLSAEVLKEPARIEDRCLLVLLGVSSNETADKGGHLFQGVH